MTQQRNPDELPAGFVEAFAAMMDAPPIVFSMRQHQAWLIVSMLQFASRHPDMSPNLLAAAREFSDQLAAQIGDPHMRRYLDMGWNPEYDQPRRKA